MGSHKALSQAANSLEEMLHFMGRSPGGSSATPKATSEPSMSFTLSHKQLMVIHGNSWQLMATLAVCTRLPIENIRKPGLRCHALPSGHVCCSPGQKGTLPASLELMECVTGAVRITTVRMAVGTVEIEMRHCLQCPASVVSDPEDRLLLWDSLDVCNFVCRLKMLTDAW